jgi:hypothetical protein
MTEKKRSMRESINEIKERKKNDEQWAKFAVELKKYPLSWAERDRLFPLPISKQREQLKALHDEIESEAKKWTRYTDRFQPENNGVYLSGTATDTRVQAVERDLRAIFDEQTVEELLSVFAQASRHEDPFKYWGANAEEAGVKAIRIVRSGKWHFWSSIVSNGLEADRKMKQVSVGIDECRCSTVEHCHHQH